MRPPALLIKLAIIIFWIFRSLVWAEESQDTLITLDLFSSSQIEPSPPLIDENKLASILRPSALFNVAGNAVTAEYIERRAEAEQLKSLWSNEERWGLLKTPVSQLADGRSIDAGYNAFNISPDGFREQQHRLSLFGLKGRWGDFDYGAEYRSLGKWFWDLDRPQLANRELWAQQKFGVLSAKASVSESANSPDENSAMPHVTKFQSGMTMNIAVPAWPVFGLSYYRGSTVSSSEFGVLRPGETSWKTVGTSLYYHASLWETTLSSTYSPWNATLLSSLGLTYRLLGGRVAITSFGSYGKTRSVDGFTINASSFLVWQLEKTSAGEKTLSFGAMSNRYVDGSHPNNSNGNLSVWVLLKIASF